MWRVSPRWTVPCSTSPAATARSGRAEDQLTFQPATWYRKSRPAANGIVFDPLYKLNGTPTDEVDERHGVHVLSGWKDRMRLIAHSIAECCRVTRRHLLARCKRLFTRRN